MCGPDFFCSEELNAKKGIHFMPISGGVRRINSKVIFAADSYWCDSYNINHSGKCRSGGWVNGSERENFLKEFLNEELPYIRFGR